MPPETEGFEHEESLGPDNPGSMAFKLARAAEAPQKKTVEPSPEEIEAARQVETTAANETAVQEAAAAEADAAAIATGEKESLESPDKTKDWTVEDYKKALKEAETRMHTATTEAAEDRKTKDDLAAEIELTKKELADVRTEQEAAAAEVAKAIPKTQRKAAYAEALKKIREIPLTRDADGEVIYPDDYDDQVAEAWAGTSVDPEEVAKIAAKLAREELKRERQVEETRTAAEKETETRVKTRADAEKIAAEQGLDMTPGSADYRLFYSHVDELADNPEHEYRDKPFEEQVKWAAGGVRQVLGKKIELTDAERAAAKRNQERNAVLERGITRNLTPETPKQRTMNEILTGKLAGSA
jgi:hypothetical protein